jgi:hypothetical protein
MNQENAVGRELRGGHEKKRIEQKTAVQRIVMLKRVQKETVKVKRGAQVKKRVVQTRLVWRLMVRRMKTMTHWQQLQAVCAGR